jgi:site-specific DNA-methyltransferase (adenine-specific)
MPAFKPNTLYYGDNLEVLRAFPPECVDLIYLDPPFNSNRSYNVLFREDTGREAEAQVQAFEDTWQWGRATSAIHETYNEFVSRGTDDARLLEALVRALGHNDVTAYLTMMAPRLVELRRVLKPTGSIYLHCDPTAGHYLKVLMDSVFGAVNFKNEIVWQRTSAHSSAKRFGPNFDTLLYYTKSENYTWNGPRVQHDPAYVARFYTHRDERGMFRLSDLTAAGTRSGPSGAPWRGVDPTSAGRHWAVPREAVREVIGDDRSAGLTTQQKLDIINQAGRVYWPAEGAVPAYKRYWDDVKAGQPAQAIWSNIPPVGAQATERLGYPTQKPEKLLERIISASSNPGDIVLDPFCGCGTAVVAAHRLKRNWIGIDIAMVAVNVMRSRLKTTFPDDFPGEVPVDGEPADEAAALDLARRNKYDFQYWVVDRLGGTPRGGENRKGADRGIDGIVRFPEHDPSVGPSTAKPQRRLRRGGNGGAEPGYRDVIISVKGGQTGPAHVRDLRGVVERESAAIGVLVTVRPPTSEMLNESAEAGVYTSPWTGKSYPKIQILTAGEIVHGKRIDMPPRRGLRQYQPAPRARRGEQSMLRDFAVPYSVGIAGPGPEDDGSYGPDSTDQA